MASGALQILVPGLADAMARSASSPPPALAVVLRWGAHVKLAIISQSSGLWTARYCFVSGPQLLVSGPQPP